MPRVNAYKKKYAEQDLYKYILGQMRMKGMNQTELGMVLGINQSAVAKKLKNHTLTAMDLIAIFNTWNTDATEVGKVMKGEWKN